MKVDSGKMNIIHAHLMRLGFPYHSVSVVYRHHDLGYHVMFDRSVEHLVTPGLKEHIKELGFTYSFVGNDTTQLKNNGSTNQRT